MASGRNYISPRRLNPHPDQHRSADETRHHRRLPPPHLLEERVIAQRREIDFLIVDNRRLASAHVALKQDLSATDQEINHLTATAPSIKAERDAQVRDVYEQSLKLEADARAVNALIAEVEQVRANIEELQAERKELVDQLKDVDGDLAKAKLELQELTALKAETETLEKEIQRGRSAIDYERKIHGENLELSETMEKHMKSMTEEINQLQSELSDAEKMAMAAAAAQGYPNPATGYGGNFAPIPYAAPQVQGGVVQAFPYAPPPVPVPHVPPPVLPPPAPYAVQLHHRQQVNSFDEVTLQILEALLVSRDVNSLVEVRSALTEFMRDESLQIVREISDKSVEYKLLCTDFLIRVFALIGDVQSCLSLRYEALVMREEKASADPRLQVSCIEWLTFAEQLLDHGFYSIANKACTKALVCINGSCSSDPETNHIIHNVHLIEKIKKLKDVSALSASSRSVQAQAVEYLMQKTAAQGSESSSISNETQCLGSSRFKSGIRQHNLRKLRAHQCRQQT